MKKTTTAWLILCTYSQQQQQHGHNPFASSSQPQQQHGHNPFASSSQQQHGHNTESTEPSIPIGEFDNLLDLEEYLNAHEENSQFDLKLIEDNNELMPSSQQQQHGHNTFASSSQQQQHGHNPFASSSQQQQQQ